MSTSASPQNLMQVAEPVVDVLSHPDGSRDRQLLFGDQIEILQSEGLWRKVRAQKDGYTGYLPSNTLAPAERATHWVSTPATHAYAKPDFKSRNLCSLSLGSRMQIAEMGPRFARIHLGYVPAFVPVTHLTPLEQPADDPVAVAETLLHTPYLWGGNSRFGIDCSGLVQLSCHACANPCPGDSGPQENELGQLVTTSATAPSEYRRGDLLFWKGHVAWVRDSETLLHANAHAMAVVIEPIDAAILRIEEQGDGPVTAHKRL